MSGTAAPGTGGRAPGAPVLWAEGITKTYGGTAALSDASFDLFAGEVHGLVGENGAGKSTMIKVLSGAVAPDAGTMTLDGKAVTFRNPADAITRGIAVVHQELSIAPHLSVAENILLGQWPNHNGVVSPRLLYEQAEAALQTVGVKLDLKAPIHTLSLARQQVVEVARAVAREARVLMLDEPSTVLGYADLDLLYDVIGKLRQKDVGIIYISHRFPELFDLTDRMTVLRDGRHVATTPSADLNEKILIEQMTGRDLQLEKRGSPRSPGKTIVSVSNLSDGGTVRSATLEVREHEILCLTGLVGSGRTEIVQMMAGATKPVRGEISIRGRKYRGLTPISAQRRGIGFLSESRRDSGILPNRSIFDNIVVASMATTGRSRFGVLRRKRLRREVQEIVDRLRIKIRDLDQPVSALSGGNQQKVLIARWLMAGPDIYIFDEPTRGIDVGTKAQIYTILEHLAEAGNAVVVVSSEAEEVLRISDRIVVVREGNTVAELSGSDMTAEKVTHAQLSSTTVIDHLKPPGEFS